MLTRRPSLFVALASGLLVGIGYPYIDLAAACRIPDSEACVWGKAYFPLTLGLSLVLLGGITAGLVYAALSWRRKNTEATMPPDGLFDTVAPMPGQHPHLHIAGCGSLLAAPTVWQACQAGRRLD